MGLSFHTKVVENHYKSWHNVIFCTLSLLGLTGYSIKLLLDDANKFTPVVTNSNANWKVNSKLMFPVMSSQINMETNPWMPLSVDFKLVENCDGITENCEQMSY